MAGRDATPKSAGPESYQHLLDPAAFGRLLQVLQRPLAPAIRINTLKTSVEWAAEHWPTWYHWEIDPVPFCATGWRVRPAPQPDGSYPDLDLARTPEHKSGQYYIQEAASMLPAEMFHLEGEPLVLDMAAAPGGKTTHLISRLADRGLVVANDSSARRIASLRVNLQDWGAMNTVITRTLGELWGGWYPEMFDRVLLDAPCSGQSLRAAERRKSRPVSDKERRSLQSQQIRLLVSGFQALRPGGELVYATCTLHPDEDEAVLEALLTRYPEAAAVASVEHLVDAPALLAAGEQRFHSAVGRAVRLWPHLYDTAGFFAALIRKQESVPAAHAAPPPARPLREQGFRPLKTAERTELLDGLRQQFGFDLEAVVEHQALALWKQRERIFALPELYLSLLANLPAVTAGMLIAERKGGKLIPSHELVSRFADRFTAGRLTISVQDGERWLMGHELQRRNMQAGVVLVQDERGRQLGRGKVVGKRIRNLLPRRLVY